MENMKNIEQNENMKKTEKIVSMNTKISQFDEKKRKLKSEENKVSDQIEQYSFYHANLKKQATKAAFFFAGILTLVVCSNLNVPIGSIQLPDSLVFDFFLNLGLVSSLTCWRYYSKRAEEFLFEKYNLEVRLSNIRHREKLIEVIKKMAHEMLYSNDNEKSLDDINAYLDRHEYVYTDSQIIENDKHKMRTLSNFGSKH